MKHVLQENHAFIAKKLNHKMQGNKNRASIICKYENTEYKNIFVQGVLHEMVPDAIDPDGTKA